MPTKDISCIRLAQHSTAPRNSEAGPAPALGFIARLWVHSMLGFQALYEKAFGPIAAPINIDINIKKVHPPNWEQVPILLSVPSVPLSRAQSYLEYIPLPISMVSMASSSTTICGLRPVRPAVAGMRAVSAMPVQITAGKPSRAGGSAPSILNALSPRRPVSPIDRTSSSSPEGFFKRSGKTADRGVVATEASGSDFNALYPSAKNDSKPTTGELCLRMH